MNEWQEVRIFEDHFDDWGPTFVFLSSYQPGDLIVPSEPQCLYLKMGVLIPCSGGNNFESTLWTHVVHSAPCKLQLLPDARHPSSHSFIY